MIGEQGRERIRRGEKGSPVGRHDIVRNLYRARHPRAPEDMSGERSNCFLPKRSRPK